MWCGKAPGTDRETTTVWGKNVADGRVTMTGMPGRTARCGVITRATCGTPWNAETVTKPGETTSANGTTVIRCTGAPPPALTNTRPWAAALAVTSRTTHKARGKLRRMVGLLPDTTPAFQRRTLLSCIQDALAHTKLPANSRMAPIASFTRHRGLMSCVRQHLLPRLRPALSWQETGEAEV